jgi:hypothetical protein
MIRIEVLALGHGCSQLQTTDLICCEDITDIGLSASVYQAGYFAFDEAEIYQPVAIRGT